MALSVHGTLQTYIYHARQMLERLGCGTAKDTIATRPPGYVLVVSEDTFDSDSFKRLVDDGIRHVGQDDDQAASDCLSAAVRLWRGRPFAGIAAGPLLSAHITYLEEMRLTAISNLIETRQRLGNHQALIPDLRLLVSEHPLNENFHSLLISALHRCGRHAEAVQAYQRLWRILDAELGVRPGLEVQKLHQAILAQPA